jgi:hypothetical protein
LPFFSFVAKQHTMSIGITALKEAFLKSPPNNYNKNNPFDNRLLDNTCDHLVKYCQPIVDKDISKLVCNTYQELYIHQLQQDELNKSTPTMSKNNK